VVNSRSTLSRSFAGFHGLANQNHGTFARFRPFTYADVRSARLSSRLARKRDERLGGGSVEARFAHRERRRR